jgi:hypothetical protein
MVPERRRRRRHCMVEMAVMTAEGKDREEFALWACRAAQHEDREQGDLLVQALGEGRAAVLSGRISYREYKQRLDAITKAALLITGAS